MRKIFPVIALLTLSGCAGTNLGETFSEITMSPQEVAYYCRIQKINRYYLDAKEHEKYLERCEKIDSNGIQDQISSLATLREEIQKYQEENQKQTDLVQGYIPSKALSCSRADGVITCIPLEEKREEERKEREEESEKIAD